MEGSDTNDLVIAFNTLTAKTHLHDIAIRAFGGYFRQEGSTFTYDTLPYDTYDEWGAAWLIYDTKVNTAGYPLDVASDYGGDTFELHAGTRDDAEDWTGTIIFSTSLTKPKSPYIYKRVPNGIDVTFNRKSAGSATVYVKKDSNSTWVNVGTASFVDDTNTPETVTIHIPFDKRIKTMQVKIESTGEMEFLGAVFRELYYDGDR